MIAVVVLIVLIVLVAIPRTQPAGLVLMLVILGTPLVGLCTGRIRIDYAPGNDGQSGSHADGHCKLQLRIEDSCVCLDGSRLPVWVVFSFAATLLIFVIVLLAISKTRALGISLMVLVIVLLIAGVCTRRVRFKSADHEAPSILESGVNEESCACGKSASHEALERRQLVFILNKDRCCISLKNSRIPLVVVQAFLVCVTVLIIVLLFIPDAKPLGIFMLVFSLVLSNLGFWTGRVRMARIVGHASESQNVKRLRSIIKNVRQLQNRLRPVGGDHGVPISLYEITAAMKSLFDVVILPLHQRCLRNNQQRHVSGRRNQVADASSAEVASPKPIPLEKTLERYALGGGYYSKLIGSFKPATGDNSDELHKLLQSFGCFSSKGERESEEAVTRLKDALDYSENWKSRGMPELTATEQNELSKEEECANLYLIESLFKVIDEHFQDAQPFKISKEVYSQIKSFHGEAQVVLVLLDKGAPQQLCARFRELAGRGCKMIGVPMPGYDISNFSEWWPDTMPEFKDFSLFFDYREPLKKLMPQIHQNLAEWVDSFPSTTPDADSAVAATPALVYDSKQTMRASMLPCPNCSKLVKTSPGVFNRDDCMHDFMSKLQKHKLKVEDTTNTKGTKYCIVCHTKVKVKDILKRPIFLSYNWGANKSTQKIALQLCEIIFLETEMPFWLDIDGGMAYGDGMVTEMREGVAGCTIVVLMISDAFCLSGNCLFEYINIVQNFKYVIPLLVPDHGPIREDGPSSGWTGLYQGQDWWKHAQEICDPQHKDLLSHPQSDLFKNIPWNYLANFTPIDLRNESYMDDGSLENNSPAAKAIIQRIDARFFSTQQAEAIKVIPGPTAASIHEPVGKTTGKDNDGAHADDNAEEVWCICVSHGVMYVWILVYTCVHTCILMYTCIYMLVCTCMDAGQS